MKIMKKRTFILLAGAVGIAAAAGFITRSSWMGGSSNAQGPQRPRMVSVELAKAERKSVPVDVDANGTVTPISSVALKSRLETTIVAVHFEDGAKVSEGDLLFTLDSRQIDAQIEQAEGVLAKDQAQFEGAQRDLRRYNDLVGKGATTQVNVDNARTQSDILIGTIKADQAALDNLKVQKSYTTIRAPFAGRISAANVKIGNFVRPADTAPLAVINQMAPVYVTFAVPQRVLVDLRESMTKGLSRVTATIPGHQRSETGNVAMVENTVDATTGMVTVRGIMSNQNESLWPGTLVTTPRLRMVVTTLTPEPNAPPVANAGPDQAVFVKGKTVASTVTLDASGSHDPDGTLVSYQWLENGAQIATGKTAAVSLGIGSHTITLRVTDDDQASSEDQLTVDVNKRGGRK